MTTTTILAYLLIICYFVIERKLRKGEKALSLTPGPFDQGSSRIMWTSGVFSLVLVLIAPILNVYQIGYWSSAYMSWLGLFIMLSGLILRYWAAKTLNEFYTRTLQIVEGHRIVNQAPYNILRHPGYLGVFLMEIGACLAIANWAVLLIIMVIGVLSSIYRIQAEEEMLNTTFGEQYKVYSQKTWRLIPLIY
ncbi:MAG: isoprenylcysteine carboxylmethyltransferase family protein [Rhizonema sp. PD37]|nr:isoprenylcysteine carboxylmethyltransferase family protein [Rhizonema sp. PD37]